MSLYGTKVRDGVKGGHIEFELTFVVLLESLNIRVGESKRFSKDNSLLFGRHGGLSILGERVGTIMHDRSK